MTPRDDDSDAHAALPLTQTPPARAFLAATPASAREQRLALVVGLVSALVFAAILPFAKQPLAPAPAFIAGYQSALVVCDIITAVLLLAQFLMLDMRALLPLAAGYLFTACMAAIHMLTFPGLFAPTGLLGATPQTTAWLYMLWHAGFPLAVMGYAWTRHAAARHRPGGRGRMRPRSRLPAVAGVVAGVMAASGALAWLATAGAALLPPIMDGNHYTPSMIAVVGSVWALSALALLALWRGRPHTVLDLWLMVVCCAWICDIGLAAVFNQGRYDLGFYAGRLYGLLAACFVLVLLLVENTDLYARLIDAHGELRRLYEKTRELDELKTRFFANVSHEIRTPMNAIVGLASLMQRDRPTPQQAERLDRIAMATRHLLAIVNDILDYSRIEAQQLRLEVADFPLATALDHVRSMMAQAAQAKGLSIEVDHEGAPAWVRGDATRIRQALLNYVGNAVKFAERGRIVVRVRQVGSREDGVLLRFEVQDEGVGIPPESLPQLFQPFVQADVSTTRRYGGTGLRLSITQRLARLMGGDAGATSQVGQGSTFWFTAWLAPGRPVTPAASADPLAELRARHAGARVLLAEDEPTNREVALTLLRDAGLAVDAVANGQDAVRQAQAHDYDLALLDIQMPVMDGIEAAARIHRMPGREQVPLVAFSANVQAEDRRRCEAAGMCEFIAKPVDPDDLYRVLLDGLARSRSARGRGAMPAHAPGVDPRALRERLDAHFAMLPGVDVEAGLRHLHGNVERYLPLLMEFVGRHRHAMARVAEAAAAGHANEGMVLAHALRGAAATLGLVRLADLAGRLEQALHGGEPAATLMRDAGGELLRIAEAVATLASEQRLEQPSDPVRAHAILQELEGLLASGEFAAAQVFGEHAPLLAASLQAPVMDDLRRRIGDYDFPAALSLVRLAQGQLMPTREGPAR